MKKILLTIILLLCFNSVASAHDCCAQISARMVSYDGGETCQSVFFKSASCPHMVSITYQVEGDVVRTVYMGGGQTELFVDRIYTGHRDARLISIECEDGHEYDAIVYTSAWASLYDAFSYDLDNDDAIYWLMATVAIVGTIVWFNAAISGTPPDYQNEYIGIGAGAGSSYGFGFGFRAAARYHAIGASLGLGVYPGSYSAGLQLHINRGYIDIEHIGMLNRGNSGVFGRQSSATAIMLGSNDIVRGRRWYMNMGFGVIIDNYSSNVYPSFDIGFGYRLFSNGYR